MRITYCNGYANLTAETPVDGYWLAGFVRDATNGSRDVTVHISESGYLQVQLPLGEAVAPKPASATIYRKGTPDGQADT